ncbi:MAG TPA: glycosyltransferase family 4 protein [Edaphocola sp.]|nr:glycosyltransferase family 4 protein [Edaphocola sp.]
MKTKLFRITTVPISLEKLLRGQHHFMSENGFEVTGVSSQGIELENVKKAEGIKTHAVEMTRTISIFKDLKSLWELYRYIKKEKPEIIHTHTPKAGIVGMLAAKFAGVPIRLHTVAGMPLMESGGWKRKVLLAVEQLTYRCATKVYPNSKGLYDFIIKENIVNPKKLKIIANGSSNGIDTSFFDPTLYSTEQNLKLRESLGIQPNDFVFIFVGRLVSHKGINELVNAFCQLQKNLKSKNEKSPKLLLVGPQEEELDPLSKATLSQMQNNMDIINLGFQKEVRPFFAISNALVFPSYREGFPNVVMQAGAMGLPCIVSDINGCNEIISDGDNGLIIPPKNSEILASKMQLLLENHELYLKLKSNARERISSRYQQSVVWEAILEEYHALLSKNGQLPASKFQD